MSGGTGKKLAKNTILMYIRMVVIMVISFITTRVLLQKLGITDYGIYDVVGSVVAMFSSLRGLFVTSTQRFLNYALGRGNINELRKILNTSIFVNLCISVVFVICIETLGLWFIFNEINIPKDKLTDAIIILQFSVLTSIVLLMTTPFDALIIAHERFSVYAGLSILDHLLKLFIIYLLVFSDNRLIFYTILLWLVSILMFLLYFTYCYKKYQECRISLKFDKVCFREMFTFAGWQFLGNSVYTLTHNGINMLLNVFGGPVANAARSIVYQVSGALNQLVINVALVLNPFSVKAYASNNNEAMFKLFFMSSKIIFLISICAVLPIFFFVDDILQIWLETVPPYTTQFVRIILIWSLFRALHQPIDTLFKSVGNIKQYQIGESIIQGLNILLSYIALHCGLPLYTVFVIIVCTELFNLVVILVIAKHACGVRLVEYMKQIGVPCLFCLLELGFIYYFLLRNANNIMFNMLSLIIAEILTFSIYYIIAFSVQEKKQIINLIGRKGRQ